MENNVTQKIKRVMADILNISEASISNETSSENTEAWDSANHIQLVVALEEEFSISFDIKEFEMMLSYPEIINLVTAKLG